ncbi:MAG: ABC transporter ATP-binding protein [Caldilineaceae bacterium]
MNGSPKSSKMPPWRYVVRLARYQPLLYLTSGLLASVMFYVTPLLPGLVVRQVLNKLTGEAPVNLSLWTLLALLIGIALARQGFMLGAVAAETSINFVHGTLLRRNILAAILHFPGAQPLPASPGEAIARLRNDVWEVTGFVSWTLDPVGQWLVMGAGLWVLARISLWTTLIIFLPIIATILAVNLASTRIQRYRRTNQEAIGAVTDLLGEIFGAVQAVKVAGAERAVIAYFERINEARRQAGLQDLLFSRLIESFAINAGNIGIGILLLTIAWTLRAGTVATALTVGDFALFVSYIGWLSIVTSMFGDYLTKYRQVGVSLQRLAALMPGAPPAALVDYAPIHLWGALPAIPQPRKRSADRLETLTACGLTYHYPATGGGIEDVNLSLPRGTVTVITGRVGAGKTTLLRTLLGLLPKAKGEIHWNGKIVSDPATFFVPPRSAYTPQAPRLYSESLRDNILMGLTEEAVNLPDALETAVLTQDLARLEQGLDTHVGPRGARLSGGQMQRTAAARMLVRGGPHGAELLVFDDLSSALDVETEQLLWARLFSGEHRPTCLVVSHRRALLQRADHILVLKDGKVEDEGTLTVLLARCQEMQALWNVES